MEVMEGVVCGYFGSASRILFTKSAEVIKCTKICHSACFGSLDIIELYASTPINVLEIAVFGGQVVIEGEGLDLFSKDSDPLDKVDKLLKK